MCKGVGAPVGSVIIGSKEDIKSAKKKKKIFGGGMRQAGYLAAAGMYALQNNISRLEEDHRKAKELGEILATLPFIYKVEPIETNIVIFTLKSDVSETQFIDKSKEKNINISNMGQGKLRMVTHLDYKQVMHDYVMETLSKISF